MALRGVRAKTLVLMAALPLAGALGCGPAYSPKLGRTELAAEPDGILKKAGPGHRRAQLSACVAADAIFLGTDWARREGPSSIFTLHSELEPIRLAYQASNCFEAYAFELADESVVSLDERIAVVLAAERSVLAADPDPADRLERASRLADRAGKLLGERGDRDEQADAELRAAWYATRASAPELKRASNLLWSQVEQSDEFLQQEFQQQAAEMNAMAQSLGGLGGIGALGRTGAGAVSSMTSTVQKAIDTANTVVKFVQMGSDIAKLTKDLAEGRADLGMLLKGGMSALSGVMPQLVARVPALRDISDKAAFVADKVDVAQTIEAAASGDDAAKAKLLGRLAHAFGAELPPEVVAATAAVVDPALAGPPDDPLMGPGLAKRTLDLPIRLKSGAIDPKTFDELRKKLLPKGGPGR